MQVTTPSHKYRRWSVAAAGVRYRRRKWPWFGLVLKTRLCPTTGTVRHDPRSGPHSGATRLGMVCLTGILQGIWPWRAYRVSRSPGCERRAPGRSWRFLIGRSISGWPIRAMVATGSPLPGPATGTTAELQPVAFVYTPAVETTDASAAGFDEMIGAIAPDSAAPAPPPDVPPAPAAVTAGVGTPRRHPLRHRPALLVAAALLTLYIVWGSTYLAIRVAVQTMPPLVMAGVRFLVAGAILYAITLRPGQARNGHTDLRHWRSALVIGGLLLAGGNGGVSWSEQFIASGLAALLVATVPLWMALIAHLTGDERLNWMMAGGIVLGLIGVAILVHPAGGASHLWGVLAVLLAAVAWAAGSIYARRAPLPAHPLLATAMEMLAGGVVLLVLATLDGEWARVHLARVSMGSALALGYLIAF